MVLFIGMSVSFLILIRLGLMNSLVPDFDDSDGVLHALYSSGVSGVDQHVRGMELALDYSFFDPEQYVIARATLVIAQVMVETQMGHLASLEQGNDLVWPQASNPSFRGWSGVV
jgi:hypothetical protein